MKKLGMLLLMIAVVGFVWAGGKTETGPSAKSAAARYVIKYAHGDPPDPFNGSAHADAVLFKSYVEDRSGGRIAVEIYPANTIGSEREQLESVKIGATQMCNVSEGTVGTFFPEILATAVPYAFKTYTEAWAVMRSPYMQKLMAEMTRKTGIRCLNVNQNGFRHFSNNVRPIRNPDDLKGLKIRTMEHRGHMKMVESLGASPVPIAWGELYTALQQKVVDGQENPPSLVYVMKFYEVQKYYTLDGHIYSIDFTFMNNKFYNDLPDDLRQIVYDGAQVSGLAHVAAETYSSNVVAVENLKKQGMEVYVPTAAELEQFQAKTQKPVIDWIKTQIDPKWVDDFMKAIQEARKGVVAPKGNEASKGMVFAD